MMDSWITITEAAERIGVTPKTLIRWEKAGKIKNAKRNWRGWRVFSEEQIQEIEQKIKRLY